MSTEYRDVKKIETLRKRLDELDERDDSLLICCCGEYSGAFTQEREQEKRKLDREFQLELAKPLEPMKA
ncbi:hypothetical protein INT48_001032 [Thamnidium elegans]|uniref:Uncharacterized protein n=1 Tax=Thamnidium elegans TaxID=101142 RepID=A0A8H7VV98_9FUNG|nr:hypothetical protein INT48_001032 [Thamnidium elegans]